jgi:hypothetical protein
MVEKIHLNFYFFVELPSKHGGTINDTIKEI